MINFIVTRVTTITETINVSAADGPTAQTDAQAGAHVTVKPTCTVISKQPGTASVMTSESWSVAPAA